MWPNKIQQLSSLRSTDNLGQWISVCSKRDREREKRIWGGEQEKRFFFPPGCKVSRHCPLILLVEVRLGEGKALGNDEKGKVLHVGCGFYHEQKREFERGLYYVRSELMLMSTLEGLH
jgi:hypothetical protein